MTAAHQCTSSATDRLLHCGWWARPEVSHAHTTSEAAERGTALHSVAEAVITRAIPAFVSHELRDAAKAAQERFPDEADYIADACTRWVTRVMAAGGSVYVEAGFALDLTSGAWREVPRSQGRDYGCSATEVAGRIDWAAWYPNERRLEIWDLKTGSKPPSPACGQMMTNAVLMSHLQPERVLTCIMHVPAPEKGVPRQRDVDLDPWEIDAHRENLKRSLALIPTSEPNKGPGCFFCPAKGICPEFGGSGAP